MTIKPLNECAESERKQTRRLLWRWGNAAAYCARRQKDISDFNELIESAADIALPALTGLPRARSASDKTACSAERLESLKEQYAIRISDLCLDVETELRFAKAVDAILETLTPIAGTVIEYRYKREWRMQDIAAKLKYSVAQIENIERAAIDELCPHFITSKKD